MAPNFGWLDSTALAQGTFITAVTIFLVVWFMIVAITGWLAGRRNREGGLWAVVALFTGPIALAVLLWLPRREKKPALSPLWQQLEDRDAPKAAEPTRNATEGGPAA